MQAWATRRRAREAAETWRGGEGRATKVGGEGSGRGEYCGTGR